MFEHVSTRAILDQVPARLRGEAARSLWRRIDKELESGGPPAASSYLHAQFGETAKRLHDLLAAAKSAE